MQEASGQAGLMNIMLTIIGIIIVLLAGSIAYSKAFRVKNRIVDAIEKNNGYTNAKDSIEKTLEDIGYRTIDKSNYTSYCPSDKFPGFELVTNKYPGYFYCIYKKSTGNTYYKVVSNDTIYTLFRNDSDIVNPETGMNIIKVIFVFGFTITLLYVCGKSIERKKKLNK